MTSSGQELPSGYEQWPIEIKNVYAREIRGRVVRVFNWGLIVDIQLSPFIGLVDGYWLHRMTGESLGIGDLFIGYPISYREFSSQVELVPSTLWESFLGSYPERAEWILRHVK